MTRNHHRALALFLCAQPVLWMSDVALAQTIAPGQAPGQPPASGSMAASQAMGPIAPTDPEVVRAERGALTAAAPPVPAIDEPLDPDRYVCGPGDVLELNFWGIQNFKLRVTIDLEGRSFVPKVGFFKLAGRTLTDARRVLRASVASYYPRLSFDVTLAEPRAFLVQVVQAVGAPGSYSARAIERVSTVIAKAGGLAHRASRRRIEIRRRDGTVLHADLLLYTLTGDLAYNPHVLDGDVVQVPFEDVAATVSGSVNRPGRYELVKTRDLAELVELAGGLAASSTRLLPIAVVRRGGNDREDLKLVEFADGRLPPLALQLDDAVHVPGAGELQQSVVIVGAIAGAVPAAAAAGTAAGTPAPDEASATRRLPFVKGDTVRTLVERAGGVGPLADLTGSYILRDGASIPVDLYALVMQRDLKADRPIALGDTLVIPFKRRNILVEGAVFAPGSYPYNPGFGIEQYVSLAGGRSRNARSLEDVSVVTPKGETKEYRPDLKIEPGSSLVVPERNFSRSEVVQIAFSIAGILLSGVAVVMAARR